MRPLQFRSSRGWTPPRSDWSSVCSRGSTRSTPCCIWLRRSPARQSAEPTARSARSRISTSRKPDGMSVTCSWIRARGSTASACCFPQARNGEIGHVDDFLIGEDSWRIRYLLVDTSNWIGGRSVIVSSEAVERVDKADNQIYVAADRDAIKNAPALDSIEE